MLPSQSTSPCCAESAQPPSEEAEASDRRRTRWLRRAYQVPWSRIWGFCTALLNFLAAFARLFLASD